MKTIFVLALGCVATMASNDKTAALENYVNNQHQHRNLATADSAPDCSTFNHLNAYKTKELLDSVDAVELKSFVCNKVFDVEMLGKALGDPYTYFEGVEDGYCRAKLVLKVLGVLDTEGKPLVGDDGSLDKANCGDMIDAAYGVSSGRRKLEPVTVGALKLTAGLVGGAGAICSFFC